MQKWEYKTILAETMSMLKPQIMEAGEEGWELVQVIYEIDKTTGKGTYYPFWAILKRPTS